MFTHGHNVGLEHHTVDGLTRSGKSSEVNDSDLVRSFRVELVLEIDLEKSLENLAYSISGTSGQFSSSVKEEEVQRELT